jgi:hypothetical protein
VDDHASFRIPWLLHLVGGWAHRGRRLLLALGRLETHTLAHELAAVPVAAPIYVCGLARAGSTVLHHLVCEAPGVAAHRVKDYPLVYTPYWRRQATRRRTPAAPRERAHGDRVLITADSPEALEEMIWTAFFPACHDPSADNRLSAAESRPDFETFYRDHIRKVLLAERAGRYAAKANYHVARLPYLLRLFPDARVVLAVREPVGHVGSLARQHRRFSEGERRHPRALAYMRRAGHFEFGLDRRPLNLGDAGRVRAVERAWAGGEEARGWALYWALVYDHLADLLASDPRVRAAVTVVRYEALCDAPAEVIRSVFHHCALPAADRVAEAHAPRISRPDYYAPPLTQNDVAVIRAETAAAAARWGYS